MTRIGKVNLHVFSIITRISDVMNMFFPAYAHMLQVSQYCAMLAEKRGENVELAEIAGLLHDIAKIKCRDDEAMLSRLVDNWDKHGEVGAEFAEELLLSNNIVSREECGIICRAISRHCNGNKDNADTAIDEILKDADVFSHGMGSVHQGLTNFRGNRWDKVCEELGMKNYRDCV